MKDQFQELTGPMSKHVDISKPQEDAMSIVSGYNNEQHPALPLVSYETDHEQDVLDQFVSLTTSQILRKCYSGS